MKLCRFHHNRVGIVDGDDVADITPLFDDVARPSWPYPAYDWLVYHFPEVRPRIPSFLDSARRFPIGDIRIDAPVANPGKIIGAPINYRDHINEANADRGINHGKTFTTLDQLGLFLKASTALLPSGGRVLIPFANRRTDHEVELVAVIGKGGRRISQEAALDHVLAYCIGLDMTVRGPEFAGFRKSADTFAVVGPWLTTADEVGDPNSLDLELQVNGERRQSSNTRYLIFNIQRLIAYASAMYTLCPGDLIFTGTPAGVGPVQPGDRISASIQRLGELRVEVDSL
jgi:2-keto-4-pentenoate hydratase/2-oxohepta-3-ene-1,7-dioic acid hydratase in catechol pathway